MISTQNISDTHQDSLAQSTCSAQPTQVTSSRPRKQSAKAMNSPALSSVRKNSTVNSKCKKQSSTPLLNAENTATLSSRKKNNTASSKISPPSHASSTLTSEIASFDLNDINSSSYSQAGAANSNMPGGHSHETKTSSFAFQRPINFSPSPSSYLNEEGPLLYDQQHQHQQQQQFRGQESQQLQQELEQQQQLQQPPHSVSFDQINMENRFLHWNWLPTEIQKTVLSMPDRIDEIQKKFDLFVPCISIAFPYNSNETLKHLREAQRKQESLIRSLTKTDDSLSLSAAVSAALDKKRLSYSQSAHSSNISTPDQCIKTEQPNSITTASTVLAAAATASVNHTQQSSPSISSCPPGISSKSKKISKKSLSSKQGGKTDIASLIPSLSLNECSRDLNINVSSNQQQQLQNYSEQQQYSSYGQRARQVLLEFPETPTQQQQSSLHNPLYKQDLMMSPRRGILSMQSLDDDLVCNGQQQQQQQQQQQHQQQHSINNHHNTNINNSLQQSTNMNNGIPFDESPFQQTHLQHNPTKLRRHMSEPYGGDFYHHNHHMQSYNQHPIHPSFPINPYNHPAINDLMPYGYDMDNAYDSCLNGGSHDSSNNNNNTNNNSENTHFKKEEEEDNIFCTGFNSQNDTFEELLNEQSRCTATNQSNRQQQRSQYFVAQNNNYDCYEDCNNVSVHNHNYYPNHYNQQEDFSQINSLNGSNYYSNNNHGHSMKQRTCSVATDLLEFPNHRNYDMFASERRPYSHNSAIL